MEPIPLVPEINLQTCPDTSHILREEFQEFLSRTSFPPKIAENLDKFNSQFEELKICGSDVHKANLDLKLDDQNLTYAERQVMTPQVQFLLDEPTKFPVQINQIYQDIDAETINKYSLIQVRDVLPHITERILDDRYPDSNKLFEIPCKKAFGRQNELDYIKKAKCSFDCDKKRNKTDNFEDSCADLNNLKNKDWCPEISFKYVKKPSEYIGKTVFSAKPTEIIFDNIQENIRYERQLNLRNLTSKSQTLTTPILSQNSKFWYKYIGKSYKIAPGMSAKFSVRFKTESVNDFTDTLLINVIGSQVIKINLAAIAARPVVKGLLCKMQNNITKINEMEPENDILNHTIDCGTCLFGLCTDMKFVVQNFGHKARFFILSEETWISREVDTLSESLQLVLKDFSITPAYFELKEQEIIELIIDFHPSRFGLCLDKIIILCDNNSVKEIDIIGDCLQFNYDLLIFNIPKEYYSCSQFFDKAKYSMNLGTVFYDQEVIANFSIFNASKSVIQFEWRMEKFKFCQNEKTFPMLFDWITLSPGSGYFEALASTKFEVRLKMPTEDIGILLSIFSLFVVEIPEICLDPRMNFVIESLEDSLLVSVKVEDLEIQALTEPYPVEIIPEELEFEELLQYNILSQPKEVIVYNNSNFKMTFNWIITPKKCKIETCIRVEPQDFEIPSKENQICNVTIKPRSYDNIEEIIKLSINNSYEKQYIITANTRKPNIHVSQQFFNLGYICRNSTVDLEFTIYNDSKIKLEWHMLEYRYDFEKNSFTETNYLNKINNQGFLCGTTDCCDVVYNLDTSIPNLFFSLIIFYTEYNDIKIQNDFVLIIASIEEPNISITNENDKENIFKCDEKFYLNEIIVRKFYLNNKSPFQVDYVWDEPFGFNANLISINFDEQAGEIEPFRCKAVEITMEFRNIGNVFDFYIPCNVEGLDSYIFLQICCKIREPHVVVCMPNLDKFRWPYVEWSEMTNLTLPDFGEEEMEDFQYKEDEEYYDYQPVRDDLLAYLKTIEIEDEFEEKVVLSEYTASSSEFGLDRWIFADFEPDIDLLTDHVIEFTNLKCYEVYKKTVEITNNMNNSLAFEIHVKNFKPKEFHVKKIDELMVDLKLKADTSYSQRLDKHGILVIVKSNKCAFDSNTTTMIEIEVYAEAWGIYLEEIGIEINNLPTLYLKLAIQVTEHPLQFVMMLNNKPEVENQIRFGNLSYCSESITQKINLRNNSVIPIKIMWHALTKNMIDFPKGHINILFDIFNFEWQYSTKCKIKIIKYIGKEETSTFDLFSIEPKEMFIKPKQYAFITITFNPKYFENNYEYCDINAILIGNVYIQDKYCNYSNCLRRIPDKYLKPIKMPLNANIAYPELDLNYVQGNTNVTIAINDIVNKTIKNYATLRVLFKNNNAASVLVAVNIEKPFQVMSVKTAITESKKNGDRNALVMPGDSLEVVLKWKISYHLLMRLCDLFYKNINNHLEDVYVLDENYILVQRFLYLYQRCDVMNSVGMTLTILFPYVTTHVAFVDFDEVCLGTFKQMTLKILNRTATKTWIRVFLEKQKDFKLDFSEGYLEPYTAQETSFYLNIFFTPKDNFLFTDTIVIRTRLPQYEIKVPLYGKGTFDEKYLCKEILIE